MSEKAARKIIAGLEDAVAHAQGDESRVRVTIIPSPKPSVRLSGWAMRLSGQSHKK